MNTPVTALAIAAFAALGITFEAGRRVGTADVHALVMLDLQAQALAEMLVSKEYAHWTPANMAGHATQTADVSLPRSFAPRAAQAICPGGDHDTDVFGARGWQHVNLHLASAGAMVIRLSCDETAMAVRLARFVGGQT